MLLNTKKELVNWDFNARLKFAQSFGTLEEKHRKTIQNRIDSMLELNAKTTDRHFKSFRVYAPAGHGIIYGHWYAAVWVADPSHTIYLGPAFWKPCSGSTEGKAAIISHEMSHFTDIGATKDGFPTPVYGLESSRKLAMRSPSDAIMHADSFRYYLWTPKSKSLLHWRHGWQWRKPPQFRDKWQGAESEMRLTMAAEKQKFQAMKSKFHVRSCKPANQD